MIRQLARWTVLILCATHALAAGTAPESTVLLKARSADARSEPEFDQARAEERNAMVRRQLTGRGIDKAAAEAAPARRNVDNAAVAVVDHRRHQPPRQVVGGAKVDLHVLIQRRRLDIQQIAEFENAGVVDQHVDTPVRLKEVVDAALKGIVVAQFELDGLDPVRAGRARY